MRESACLSHCLSACISVCFSSCLSLSPASTVDHPSVLMDAGHLEMQAEMPSHAPFQFMPASPKTSMKRTCRWWTCLPCVLLVDNHRGSAHHPRGCLRLHRCAHRHLLPKDQVEPKSLSSTVAASDRGPTEQPAINAAEEAGPDGPSVADAKAEGEEDEDLQQQRLPGLQMKMLKGPTLDRDT